MVTCVAIIKPCGHGIERRTCNHGFTWSHRAVMVCTVGAQKTGFTLACWLDRGWADG